MISLVDGIFWGLILIVVGVWFIVRHALPVHIPLFRVLIAVFFVYLGVRVLVKGPAIRERNTVVFSDSQVMRGQGDHGNDYNIIFSAGVVDLSNVEVTSANLHKDVNVVFGNGILHINPAVPARVDMTAAFGTVEAPNGNSVAFGETVYTTPAYREGYAAMVIKATAVFSRLRITE